MPEAFAERMQRLLGSEYEAFVTACGQERQYGLRRNLLKGTEEQFIRVMPFPLERISWAREGYYYGADDQPGRHLLHEAGVYYIQEPSAMAAVEILDPRPGERILDLCAAPGGKTTQIAGRMQGQGLLVANELMPERAKILARNVERMGVRNCVVCAEKPERMARLFPVFFDRILVDAPCSGEGMFRKEAAAKEQWSPDIVEMCAKRQKQILAEAAKMLRPGGILVYSTCTFSPQENEGTVSTFVNSHEDFYIEETTCDEAFSPGRAAWIQEPAAGIHYTMRLWPHRLRGEGHYVARLRRQGSSDALDGTRGEKTESDFLGSARGGKKGERKNTDIDKKLCKLVEAFLQDELGVQGKGGILSGRIQVFGEQIYLLPAGMIPLTGVKVLRPGLQLLTSKKNRFEPAHALALALSPEDMGKSRALTQTEAEAYLRGEGLSCGEEKGWLLLTYEGYSLGFGKASGGQIKNHYPKGLRKT